MLTNHVADVYLTFGFTHQAEQLLSFNYQWINNFSAARLFSISPTLT